MKFSTRGSIMRDGRILTAAFVTCAVALLAPRVWANSCVIENVKLVAGQGATAHVVFPPAGVAAGQFLQLAGINLGDKEIAATAEAIDAVSGAVLANFSGTIAPKRGLLLNSPIAAVRKNVELNIVIDVISAGFEAEQTIVSFCVSLELVDGPTDETLRTYEPSSIVIIGDVITP